MVRRFNQVTNNTVLRKIISIIILSWIRKKEGTVTVSSADSLNFKPALVNNCWIIFGILLVPGMCLAMALILLQITSRSYFIEITQNHTPMFSKSHRVVFSIILENIVRFPFATMLLKKVNAVNTKTETPKTLQHSNLETFSSNQFKQTFKGSSSG